MFRVDAFEVMVTTDFRFMIRDDHCGSVCWWSFCPSPDHTDGGVGGECMSVVNAEVRVWSDSC